MMKSCPLDGFLFDWLKNESFLFDFTNKCHFLMKKLTLI